MRLPLVASIALLPSLAIAASVGSENNPGGMPKPTCEHPVAVIEQEGKANGLTETKLEGTAFGTYVSNGVRLKNPEAQAFFSWAGDANAILVFESQDLIALHMVNDKGCSIAVVQVDRQTHRYLMTGKSRGA